MRGAARTWRRRYALANGTVGVYQSAGQRRWRVKMKHEVTSILGFDLDGDGEPELISGWSNGKFEVCSEIGPDRARSGQMRSIPC